LQEEAQDLSDNYQEAIQKLHNQQTQIRERIEELSRQYNLTKLLNRKDSINQEVTTLNKEYENLTTKKFERGLKYIRQYRTILIKMKVLLPEAYVTQKILPELDRIRAEEAEILNQLK